VLFFEVLYYLRAIFLKVVQKAQHIIFFSLPQTSVAASTIIITTTTTR
jgi:hypothetical protein